jgi:protein-S-isoprenylcysteine O-methyltransferase Ste14
VNHSAFDALTVIDVILLLIFYVYWAISAGGEKKDVPGKGSRSGWVLSRVGLGLIFVLLIVFKRQELFQFWNFACGLSFFRSGAVRITGVVLTALGLAFAVWARLHLGRNWSARPTMKVGHELVTTGPYRIVRLPIYTGLLTAWLGFGLVNCLVSMSVFLVFALAFIWRVRVEEVYMMELFPDQYPTYRVSTKALIPTVW